MPWQALEDLLAVSGLISKPGGDWAGGATVAVQIGDILDRGVGEVWTPCVRAVY